MVATITGTRTDLLVKVAKRIRYYILTSTTQAGSGHPTPALSATDLLTGLMFGGTFRFDADQPDHPNNDRLIFSKGHASPLLYALWAAAGKVSEEELMTYRQFGSILGSVMLYPCDAVSTQRLVEAAAAHDGIVYLRTTRGATPVIYDNDDMNLICLGGRVLGRALAWELVRAFLAARFSGADRHVRRLAMMRELE